MKRLIIFLLFAFNCFYSFCQKPTIDTSVYNKWPTVDGAAVSNNGKYILYKIKTGTSLVYPVATLILQSTANDWKLKIPEVMDATFTIDNRYVIFLNSNDSLGIVTLGGESIKYIPNVKSYTLSRQDSLPIVIYQRKDPATDVVVCNLYTRKEISFASVRSYIVNQSGCALLFLSDTGNTFQSLNYFTLSDSKLTTIWQGNQKSKLSFNNRNVVFDKSGLQLVFGVDESSDRQTKNSIWYYKVGMYKANCLVDKSPPGVENGLKLDYIKRFASDGKRLFVNLKESDNLKGNPDAVALNIWSYTDEALQSYQLKHLSPANYTAVLNIETRELIRLEYENEFLRLSDNDSMGLVLVNNQAEIEKNSRKVSKEQFIYLMSVWNGKRTPLKFTQDKSFYLSPGGKYLVYYDKFLKNYFSYEVVTKITRNITKLISTSWSLFQEDRVKLPPAYIPAGWLKGDAALFLYDQNDIWQVDPAGHIPPINVTNGFGKRNNICFEIIKFDGESSFEIRDSLILSAFNRKTKQNGFFTKVLGRSGDPVLLSMGNYFFYAPNAAIGVVSGNGFKPLKANNAQMYLVRRMSAKESPNYFCTPNFKNFMPISNVYPEKDYNWFTTELHTWESLDGKLLQGILYKPENFNPKRKYPVIFNYYEIKSNELNIYIEPDYSIGNLNIPWYVSNGYLVFSPDIHYTIGEPGKGAYNAVISAAGYLSKLHFVDSRKMGIQGLSWGGFETNYLVTHSKLFAAACTSSGIFNFISNYGSLHLETGLSMQKFFHKGQARMGYSLWEKPELYIRNSPVFNADKVTTPILMMHTPKDPSCHFSQAIEFFTALCYLDKKVWMLEYTDGYHGVYGKSSVDFTSRMSQFFDHYLKNAPAPKWMTEGIPAKLKGLKSGFDLSGDYSQVK